jgi:type II secretory pathway pseudopilin PulG
VAISIIGILITVGLVVYTSAQRGGRDARRKQDLKSLATALEEYREVHGHYPYSQVSCGPQNGDGAGCTNDLSNWPHSTGSEWTTLSSIMTPQYLSALPNDPKSTGTSESWAGGANFAYDYWSGLSTGLFNSDCPQGPGLVYVLTTRLENASDKDGVGNGGQRIFCGTDMLQFRGAGTPFPNNEYVLVGY